MTRNELLTKAIAFIRRNMSSFNRHMGRYECPFCFASKEEGHRPYCEAMEIIREYEELNREA